MFIIGTLMEHVAVDGTMSFRQISFRPKSTSFSPTSFHPIDFFVQRLFDR